MIEAIISPPDTGYLDVMLMDGKGRIKPVPYAVLKGIPHLHLRVWCKYNAIYTIPTTELIDYLKTLLIPAKHPLEICAGVGSLGRSLGIVSTDSYMQTLPEIVSHYQLLGERTTSPPPDVIKMEAIEAIEFYKPDYVLGAFVTQKFKKGDEENNTLSSVYGVDEMRLSRNTKHYIKIGNDNVHGNTRIMNRPHETVRPEFLVTRAMDQSLNAIYIFNF